MTDLFCISVWYCHFCFDQCIPVDFLSLLFCRDLLYRKTAHNQKAGGNGFTSTVSSVRIVGGKEVYTLSISE